jgi:hypothetical protein
MTNDCWQNALTHIKNKKRNPFKKQILDTIPVFKIVWRNLLNVLKLVVHRASLRDSAAALSACTGNLITEEMLRSVLDVFIMCAGTTMITAPFMLSYFISGQFAKVFLLFVIALAPILMTIIWSACSILEEIQEQGL